LRRAAKALEGALAEIKLDAFPRCPTRAVCGAYISLQREVIELLELKRAVQAKQVRGWAGGLVEGLPGCGGWQRSLREGMSAAASHSYQCGSHPALLCHVLLCSIPRLQHMLAGMKRAKREEDGEDGRGGEKRQRMGSK
jgi:hypothetical protein